jgi:transcriptional regulator with XRE-family HTH domain
MDEMNAERLKRRRKELGLTQRKIREQTGVSETFVSNLENGKKQIDNNQLTKRVLRACSYIMENNICKNCRSWRRTFEEPTGACSLIRAEVFTEAGLRRKFRTYESDTCANFRDRITHAEYAAGIRRVTPDLKIVPAGK